MSDTWAVIMNDIPLIWTTRGNVPVDSLTYTARWELNDNFVKFIETYKDGDEVVKENAHICMLKGEGVIPQTSSFS